MDPWLVSVAPLPPYVPPLPWPIIASPILMIGVLGGLAQSVIETVSSDGAPCALICSSTTSATMVEVVSPAAFLSSVSAPSSKGRSPPTPIVSTVIAIRNSSSEKPRCLDKRRVLNASVSFIVFIEPGTTCQTHTCKREFGRMGSGPRRPRCHQVRSERRLCRKCPKLRPKARNTRCRSVSTEVLANQTLDYRLCSTIDPMSWPETHSRDCRVPEDCPHSSEHELMRAKPGPGRRSRIRPSYLRLGL